MNDRGSGCGGVIVMAVIAFFAWKWIDGGGRWTGWVYPNSSDLTQEVRLGEFKSFEDCQAGAINALRSLRATDGDYECGRRCRYDASIGLNVCKETRKWIAMTASDSQPTSGTSADWRRACSPVSFRNADVANVRHGWLPKLRPWRSADLVIAV